MPKPIVGDPTCVWAYGIKQPGWYCAKWIWAQAYADHLQSLGYKTLRSVGKPTEDGRPTDAQGRPASYA